MSAAACDKIIINGKGADSGLNLAAALFRLAAKMQTFSSLVAGGFVEESMMGDAAAADGLFIPEAEAFTAKVEALFQLYDSWIAEIQSG